MSQRLAIGTRTQARTYGGIGLQLVLEIYEVPLQRLVECQRTKTDGFTLYAGAQVCARVQSSKQIPRRRLFQPTISDIDADGSVN